MTDELSNKGRTGQYDLLPSVVHQRHLFQGLMIFTGLSANRPSNSPVTEKLAYFATDTGVFSLWNGTAWKSTTLS